VNATTFWATVILISTAGCAELTRQGADVTSQAQYALAKLKADASHRAAPDAYKVYGATNDLDVVSKWGHADLPACMQFCDMANSDCYEQASRVVTSCSTWCARCPPTKCSDLEADARFECEVYKVRCKKTCAE
jgi:hypothetical protein